MNSQTAALLEIQTPPVDAERHLFAVPDLDPSAVNVQPNQMVDLDTIPELRIARERGAVQAKHILAANRTKLIEGEFDDVPMPVDPGGTARHVVAVGRQFGKDSPQYQQAFDGLVLDNERLIGEAERANTFEYFMRAEELINPATGHFESGGIDIQDITERGLSPIADAEETLRRINDYTKEVANSVIPKIHVLGKLGLSETVTTRTVSECLDKAIEDYEEDKKSAHGGYVPAIKKLMINDITFNKYGQRFQEQIGISGLYITHDVIMTVLAKLGGLQPDQQLDKTELHNKQFKVGDELLGFVALLDAEASRVSGKDIFMGEVVEEGHPKDYSTIIEEAEERRAKLAPKPTELANYLIELEEKGTDRFVVEGLVDRYINEMLLEVARKDPSKAEAMFDEQTARGFEAAQRLEAAGYHNQARQLIQETKDAAPKASYCGAGSCGLEAVAESSSIAQIGRSLGLRGKNLLKDTERACPDCKKKTVMYDSSANKACTNPKCGKTEIHNKVSNKPQVNRQEKSKKDKPGTRDRGNREDKKPRQYPPLRTVPQTP